MLPEANTISWLPEAGSVSLWVIPASVIAVFDSPEVFGSANEVVSVIPAAGVSPEE